jgi:hypothetical protein
VFSSLRAVGGAEPGRLNEYRLLSLEDASAGERELGFFETLRLKYKIPFL